MILQQNLHLNRFDDTEEEVIHENQEQPHNFDTTPSYNQNNQYDINPYQNNPYDNNPNLIQNQYTSSAQPYYSTKKYYFQPITTTRSPYDFKNFGFTSSVNPYSTSNEPSTNSNSPNQNNPYINSFLNFRRQTTKNPYDFGNFGKTTQSPYNINYDDNINNNYLKRSYNIASYYSDSSNINQTFANGRLSQ